MVFGDFTTVMMATGLKAVNLRDQKRTWIVQTLARRIALLLIRTLPQLRASAIITAIDPFWLGLMRGKIPGLRHTSNV